METLTTFARGVVDTLSLVQTRQPLLFAGAFADSTSVDAFLHSALGLQSPATVDSPLEGHSAVAIADIPASTPVPDSAIKPLRVKRIAGAPGEVVAVGGSGVGTRSDGMS